MSISQNFPNTRPSLNLNFARSKTLDPRITFTRTSTGTYVDESGVIRNAVADEPRFDHDPVTGECLGLMIEEGRTNYFHGTQPGSGGTVSDGNVVGADGVIAKKFVPNAGSVSFPSINSRTNYTIPAGLQVNGGTVDISFTGYIAALADDLYTPDIVIQISTGASNSIYAELLPNLSNGTVWSKSGIGVNGVTELIAPQITLMPFGMYKITWSIRYTQGATIRDTVSYYLQCRQKGASPANTTGVYTADGVNGFQYSCLQYEIGSFPTSYIPTTTTSVTRTPDNASMTGTNFSSWYNPTEWTLMIAARRNYSGNFLTYPNLARINDGTVNNNVAFYGAQGSPQFTNYSINSGGVNQTPYEAINVPTTSQFKMIQALKENDSTFGGNGTLTTTDTSVLMPVGVNQLLIGVGNWGGTIQQLTYYPVRLPNATLQTLTK